MQILQIKVEDTAYALILCQSIKYFWKIYLPDAVMFNRGMLVMEMAMRVKDRGSIESLEMFFILTWSYWYQRNKWVHDKICLHPSMTIENDLSLHKCYKCCLYQDRS